MIKILALDDDLTLRQFFGMLLQIAGYHYISTDNPPEALAIIRNDSIDLFIMSYDLAKEGYWEDYYDVMKADPDLSKIGVIVLMPKTDPGRDIYVNGDYYLYIPFPREDLLITTEKVLRHYGKSIPTAAERQRQFEQHRHEMKYQFNWSDMELEKHRKDLLQKAGYKIDQI